MSARNLLVPALLAGAVLAVGCSREPSPPPETTAAAPPVAPAPLPETGPAIAPAPASATVHVIGDGIAGDFTFSADGDGARIAGTLTGLAANSVHGLHVHETGDCSDFANGSAGKHFNPGDQPHGGPDAAARHAGDLPNATADGNGTASVDARVAGLAVGTHDALDIAGRALVVHEGQDDYATQPSGASGKPVACGVIELVGGEAPPPAAP